MGSMADAGAHGVQEILDHGYLKYIEHWGSDEGIVEAARMSTQKGFLGWEPLNRCVNCGMEWTGQGPPKPDDFCGDCKHEGTIERVHSGDERLLRYLRENKHDTPFEMAGLTIEVQAPIFVFREWHRHRVPFGYNEASARYAPLPDLHYVPSIERMLIGGGHLTKQAGSIKDSDILTPEIAANLIAEERAFNEASERFYQKKLKAGVPKELARTHLGVSRYSKMRATGNLRGWLAFIALRSAPTAQWEIRQYSDAVGRILEQLFPRTWSLFEERPKR